MSKYVDSILMIRPSSFRSNSETTVNNYFQKLENNKLPADFILKKALTEFDDLVEKIKFCGFKVHVFQDDLIKDTPDSIFPNNWVTFHDKKRIAIYPMYAKNRRLERNENVIKYLENKNLVFDNIIDYSSAESDGLFLEGTGSMVLDRLNRKAYCSISERTNEKLVYEFCEDFDYMPIVFKSFHNFNNNRMPIYHTNVMMCIASHYAIICLESIDNKIHKKNIYQSLNDDNKEIIEITEKQLESFSGNMIELVNEKGSYLFMSETAYKSLNKNQISQIEKFSKLVYSKVDTIERCGGGSVRCMIAEIFN